MKVIRTIDEMKRQVYGWRKEGFCVGLVSTMGYLHEGHMSLVKASRTENDKTVVSIFVNPKQFGEGEDLDVYPRDEKGDLTKCESGGVDAVFMPSVNEMYPKGFSIIVDVNGVSDGMAGDLRPGHFQGVCTVVSKLFNITVPHKAYFGQKDAQQLAVIKKMVADLNMNLEVIGCPTIREADGLAMSSRNSYLSSDERKDASEIIKALICGKCKFDTGISDVDVIKNDICKYLKQTTGLEPDYLEIVDPLTMTPKEALCIGDLCLISVKVGRTNLIDNIEF